MKNKSKLFERLFLISVGILFLYSLVSKQIESYKENKYQDSYQSCLDFSGFDDGERTKKQLEIIKAVGVDNLKEEFRNGNQDALSLMFPPDTKIEQYCSEYAHFHSNK